MLEAGWDAVDEGYWVKSAPGSAGRGRSGSRTD